MSPEIKVTATLDVEDFLKAVQSRFQTAPTPPRFIELYYPQHDIHETVNVDDIVWIRKGSDGKAIVMIRTENEGQEVSDSYESLIGALQTQCQWERRFWSRGEEAKK